MLQKRQFNYSKRFFSCQEFFSKKKRNNFFTAAQAANHPVINNK